MSPLQIILIGLITFIIFAIILFMMMNSGAKKKDDKLSLIRGSAIADGGGSEKDSQNKRRAEIAKKLKDGKEETQADKKKVTIALKLEQAGLSFSVAQFWMASVVMGVVFLGLGKFMGQPLHIIGLMGVVGLLGMPRFILSKIIKRRQKKFLEEFADALEAMVRLLKAGMPVSEAIAMVAREYDGPVGDEMSRVYDKQKIGIPIYEAAKEGCERMPLTEMQMFATGLAIQAQTGSSLSEVLMNLSGVIRARFRLKRKIMALSSEAIASASIIGALPLVVAFGLWATSPGYLDPLLYTETGHMLLMGAGFWMGCGIFVMKQMINFKI